MSAPAEKKLKVNQDPQETIAFVEELKRQWVETLDAIPDPFIMVNDQFRIARANEAMAEIARTDVKKLVGKTCFEVFAGRESPCENCHMKNSRAGEPHPGYEIYNAKNDRWYEVATRRLKPVSGQQGVVQIYRDRTEAKKLQNQLAQNEKLASIGQLAGGFAHEINNPLGGILVFSQMLLREVPTDSQHYQDIVEIEAAAKRCKIIVENLLDYARQRPLRPKITDCNVHEIISNAVKFAALGNNQRNRYETDYKFGAKHFIFKSDSNRLTQIFLNLCNNAFQAMPDGGKLSIKTDEEVSKNETFLVVRISDTGSGIRKDDLRKIFEPFFTTKEPGQGTGLGLSIVHGILQDIGGSIEVTSKEGKGSTFTVKLPIPNLTEKNEVRREKK
jgi:two-component system NtrC family sensor kinase